MCNQLKINGLDMKRIACLWGLLLICTVGWAQTTWYNPLSVGATVETFVRGQGWNEDGGNYVRLPQRAQDKVREPVWRLANQSAGLSVRFRTDAPTIWVQYTVTGAHAMPHMPATGVSGLDYTGLATELSASVPMRLATRCGIRIRSIGRRNRLSRRSMSSSFRSTTE